MTEVVVWSGWVGGLAVGTYALLQWLVSGNALGASTGFGNICSYVSNAPFFHEGEYQNANNWRLWFLLGIPLGGLLAALTSPGEIVVSFAMGEMYDHVLPQALWAKALVLTLGGVMIGYGARLAGGCTSGHAIAGIAMLNPPSVLASAGFFVGGFIMVQLLFRLLV
ncbi:MAG: YeeE/YedE family protein [candidate division KSB1 bacterium]|nr:YeeE/YedE family protein [candidate division KSB1 bacterium]MDZ7274577.1 YeeE/YedE family protein [candidate division KSB1 bacterium]MDZ7284762.1 YeeE/YedE family protein [candidate division KSB1 bacterium]MDZ7297818.1 YeeE/YedE family protein [candidate division KSB1 bacterium]MDZ7307782.1 YeeE/YedE family protein [candidate division KSB1 bacterium]